MTQQPDAAKWNAAPCEFAHAADSAGPPAPARRFGRVDMLKRMLRAVNYSHPGAKRQLLRRKVSHFARCALQLEAFRDRFGDTANLALQETLALRPALITCVIHPYLNVDWRFEEKLNKISDHYRLLHGRLGVLRFAPEASVVLADLGEGIQIRLHKLVCFEHEGELTISLFGNELRLYSLTFMLGQINPELVAYAGGLQGLKSPEAIETYRLLTHRMHGLRPRDLIVTAFRLLCCTLGVARIRAISDRKRICSNSDHSPKSQIFSSYDSAWIECGGVAADDAFFELSPQILRRAPMETPSRKRSLYRRRYAMIDAMAGQIDAAVTHAHRFSGSHEGRIRSMNGSSPAPWIQRASEESRDTWGPASP